MTVLGLFWGLFHKLWNKLHVDAYEAGNGHEFWVHKMNPMIG